MMMSKNSYFNKTFFKNLMKRFWIIGLGMMVSYVLLYLYPIYRAQVQRGINTMQPISRVLILQVILLSLLLRYLQVWLYSIFTITVQPLQLFILCLLKDQNSIGHLLLQG